MNLPDLTLIIGVAVVLVVGWILLRVALRLTAALFRIGCFVIFLIVALAALFVLL